MKKIFNHKIKVYYEDTDAGGVVYYANYLNYLERARTEALLTIGLSNTKIKNDFGAFIIVKSCNIEYKKSTYLEDDLEIKSFINSISKTSFFMNQLIFRKNELVIDSKTHLVFINENAKPIKIPDIVVERFKPYISKI